MGRFHDAFINGGAELIYEWEDPDGYGFALRMYDTGRRTISTGRAYVAYELYDGEELVFEGDDFSPGTYTAIDSDEAAAALLGFLSLRPGDTDDEYFEDYTERQLEWVGMSGEMLGLYADELRRQS